MAHNLWPGLFDNTHTQRGPAAVDASTAATADGDRNGVGAGDGVELQTVVAGQGYFNKSSSFAAALLSASAKDIKQGQGEGEREG